MAYKRGKGVKQKNWKPARAADYIPWKDVKTIINDLYQSEEYEYVMIVLIGVFLGIRYCDIRQIKWEDIIGRDKLILKEQKTGKMRELPINKQLRETATKIYNKTYPGSEYVTRLTPEAVLMRLRKLKEKYNINVDVISPNSLRKSFGRHFLEINNYSGKSLLLLCEAFRHSSPGITRRYLGITKDEMNRIYDDISKEQLITT
jgi:integrase